MCKKKNPEAVRLRDYFFVGVFSKSVNGLKMGLTDTVNGGAR